MFIIIIIVGYNHAPRPNLSDYKSKSLEDVSSWTENPIKFPLYKCDLIETPSRP
jgi:hypothetical protein